MKIRTQNERLTSVMKIRVNVKDYVALSFLVLLNTTDRLEIIATLNRGPPTWSGITDNRDRG